MTNALLFDVALFANELYAVNELIRGKQQSARMKEWKGEWVRRTNSAVTPMSATVTISKIRHAQGFTSGSASLSSCSLRSTSGGTSGRCENVLCAPGGSCR